METNRICQYRHCERTIPESRRSDAKYCCNEHAWKEKNLRKNDNTIRVNSEKEIRKAYAYIDRRYKEGKNNIPISVLEFDGFNQEVLTHIVDLGHKDGIFKCQIHDYILRFTNESLQIEKNQNENQ